MFKPELSTEQRLLAESLADVDDLALLSAFNSGEHELGGARFSAVKLELSRRESVRDAESADKRDTREKETLSIAREANRIASLALVNSRFANKIAITAAILATVATIIAAVYGVKEIKWLINSVISSLH